MRVSVNLHSARAGCIAFNNKKCLSVTRPERQRGEKNKQKEEKRIWRPLSPRRRLHTKRDTRRIFLLFRRRVCALDDFVVSLRGRVRAIREETQYVDHLLGVNYLHARRPGLSNEDLIKRRGGFCSPPALIWPHTHANALRREGPLIMHFIIQASGGKPRAAFAFSLLDQPTRK